MLARKPHIEHQWIGIPIRILIRHTVAERLALQIPRPHRHIARHFDDHAWRAQVIGFDVVQLVAVGDQADRQIVQPDRLL